MHASCESPWHSFAKHCVLETCFLLTVPFRGMLLTPQDGLQCLAPTAHQIPVYLMVFSTFLCRAFTAHHPQHITLTALAQVVTQPRVATQLVIAGDPAVRYLITPRVEHFSTLLVSRVIPLLLWHVTFLASLLVLCPILGQGQAKVEQGMVEATDVSHEDADLAIVDFASVTTPLALDPH